MEFEEEKARQKTMAVYLTALLEPLKENFDFSEISVNVMAVCIRYIFNHFKNDDEAKKYTIMIVKKSIESWLEYKKEQNDE